MSLEVVSCICISLVDIFKVIDSWDSCTLYLSYCHRLQRTSEFSVYGHGQQRRAIIEAVRLYEEEKKNGSKTSVACESGEDLNSAAAGAVCPEYAKDLSKKWQKFVTQVANKQKNDIICVLYGLLIARISCLSHIICLLQLVVFNLFPHFREKLPVKLQSSAVRLAMR